MTPDRRSLLTASLGLPLAAAVTAHAAPAANDGNNGKAKRDATNSLVPNAPHDQTQVLQALIDAAAAADRPLRLPAGTFQVSDLRLRAGTCLIGDARRSVLAFSGGAAFVTADKADALTLRGLTFDGAYKPFDHARGEALLNISRAKAITLDDIVIANSSAGGLDLTACSGRVTHTHVHDVIDYAIKSLDAGGLDLRANTIARCGNNGILVWRSEPGDDGTIVASNRISHIRNASGGTGEYGNGINVYRAAGVLVEGNRITDCTYTAVRGNAASNIQIIANSCERLGEVAIYSEFGFEGCIIANNVIDSAASGISVTNFNEGGRLAVVQGNLIRNLFRREQEPDGEKRGEGIGVEADAAVTGNTIEGAPTVGIQIGWGPFMRDVAVSGNVIRRARVGIAITNASDAGPCLIASNLISQSTDGAIRTMIHGDMLGPDLAREPDGTGKITLSGNVAV